MQRVMQLKMARSWDAGGSGLTSRQPLHSLDFQATGWVSVTVITLGLQCSVRVTLAGDDSSVPKDTSMPWSPVDVAVSDTHTGMIHVAIFFVWL